MSTTKQDKQFSEMMVDAVEIDISSSALDSAIEYIINEFDPQDIYPEDVLKDWAEGHGYVKAD